MTPLVFRLRQRSERPTEGRATADVLRGASSVIRAARIRVTALRLLRLCVMPSVDKRLSVTISLALGSSQRVYPYTSQAFRR
jgi:hypothetical protein